MSKYEISLVVEAPNLSTAIGRFIWDDDGEAPEWLKEIKWVEEVID